MTSEAPVAPAARTLVDPGRLTYDDRGLLAVVAQDVATGTVLMLAWANREAVERTLESGLGWFWSRSRGELWCKGATSGNYLEVVEVLPDCDGDSLLYRVRPRGPACHVGSRSCFESAAGSPAVGELELGWLYRVLEGRRESGDGESSYTARLLAKGRPRIAQKVAEEAAETVIASLLEPGGFGATARAEASPGSSGASGASVASENSEAARAWRDDLVGEAGDLLYHLLVLLLECGIPPREVAAKLLERHPSSQAVPRPGSTGAKSVDTSGRAS